jgi:hypothetical protein
MSVSYIQGFALYLGARCRTLGAVSGYVRCCAMSVWFLLQLVCPVLGYRHVGVGFPGVLQHVGSVWAD